MSELAHKSRDNGTSSASAHGVHGVQMAMETDLYLPAHLIVRLALADKAWHDGVSWRVSTERRLWPLWMQPAIPGPALRVGTPVRFTIPSWPTKHGATDHTSTTDHMVRGWVAGEDADGILVVDAEGTVWAGLCDIEINVDYPESEGAPGTLVQSRDRSQ